MAKDGVRPDQVCTCDQDKKAANYISCFDTQKGILENYQSEYEASAEYKKDGNASQQEAESLQADNQQM